MIADKDSFAINQKEVCLQSSRTYLPIFQRESEPYDTLLREKIDVLGNSRRKTVNFVGNSLLLLDSPGAEYSSFNDKDWETVGLPHSFSIIDSDISMCEAFFKEK